MSNRFTYRLLTAPDPQLLSTAICVTLGVTDSDTKFFNRWFEVTGGGFDYIDISDTMICLLAAMSDEDIDELVINYVESLNVK